MSNRLFQGLVYQMRDTIDRMIGVIDESATIIACSDLTKIGEAMTGKEGFKNLRFLLTVLLNEGDDPENELTEREVGKLIHVGNLNAVKDAIFAAISVGNTGSAVPAEVDEDDAKNVETGKAK